MLESKHLISSTLSLDSLFIAGTDNTFSVYFHDQYGYVSIANGSVYSQTILAYPYPSDLLDHSLEQFSRISSSVNVNFEIVDTSYDADIAIYYDSEIVLENSNGDDLGLTVFYNHYASGRKWIEIYLNSSYLQYQSFDLKAYVFNHELLHALGFEHTFDDSDDDFYLSTNPHLSSTPEETSMSYRPPLSGIYPSDFSSADYLALQDIWGSITPSPLSDNKISVFRLFSPALNKHLFSSNTYEIDLLTGLDGNHDFINEGVAYMVSESAPDALFRFYNTNSGSHFYSASTTERDFLISNPSDGFLYEGVAYHVFLDNSDLSLQPVIRYFDPFSSSHFFTSSSEEQDILSISHPHLINEGIAWYV